MQEYPVRTIVSEPFVNQIEVIEKTLIELRNQPSSYYGRRNNRVQLAPQLSGHSSGQTHGHSHAHGHVQQQGLALFYKYGNFYPQDYYGYRQRDFKGNTALNQVNGVNGGNNALNNSVNSVHAVGSLGSNLSGSSAGYASVHSNGSSGSVDMPSLGAPTHVPQVFDESAPDHKGLATFDPFETKDYTREGMFQPMFNSSNTILGSGFSGSPNIWGDSKTMASDAAVWG